MIVRSLKEIEGTKHEVSATNWMSRRLLLRDDKMADWTSIRNSVSVSTVPVITKPSGKIKGIGNVFVTPFIIAC
jgi:hypothetical protein